MEEWRDIEGYEGLYQVSSEGRVKSLERDNNGKNQYGGCTMRLKEKILRPWHNGTNDKHLRIELRKDGKRNIPLIHILVAKAFVPNPNGYTTVHHIDHNPQNNMVENLVWMSEEEHNKLHRTEQAEELCMTVYQHTLEGKLVGIYVSAKEAARQTGFAQSHISDCCNGGHFDKSRNKWKCCNSAYGYKWSYTPL